MAQNTIKNIQAQLTAKGVRPHIVARFLSALLAGHMQVGENRRGLYLAVHGGSQWRSESSLVRREIESAMQVIGGSA